MACFALATALSCLSAHAAESATKPKFSVPKNEYGQPDLRGVWNFSSDTPLERPAQYRDREFLTADEAGRLHRQIEERSEAADQAGRGVAVASGNPGGYNQFWIESLAQQTNLRTSLIID